MSGPTLTNLVTRRTEHISTEALIARLMKVAEFLADKPLYPYQIDFGRRIIEAILEREMEELTALFSRQAGKTETVASVGGALMLIMPTLAQQFPEDDRFCYLDPKSGAQKSYRDGFWIGVFAPKKEQAQIAFNRLKFFFKREKAVSLAAEVGTEFDTFNGDTVSLSSGSFIKCFTASDQANIEGHTLHLGILDESQDISDEKASKSIGPMLAATGGSLVKIGTANAHKSHFSNAIRRNERRFIEGAKKNHFFVPWDIAAKYSTLYEAFVRKEMTRLGERSDEFQMAYNCRFMLHRGQAIDEATFASRTVVEGPFSYRMVRPRMNKYYVAGIDFGKLHDSTVVTIVEVDWDNPREVLSGTNEEGFFEIEIYGKHVCDWLEIQGDDYESQYHQIRTYLRPWGIKRICLDNTGVGTALGDRFTAHYEDVDVQCITFSDDMKDTIGRTLLQDIATARITWPGNIDLHSDRNFLAFRAQLLDVEKDYKRGLLDLHAPEIRGAHDDYFFSLCLADYAACHKPFGGEVEETTYNLNNV